MCTIPRGLSKPRPASPSTEVCCLCPHHKRMLTWPGEPGPGWTKGQVIPWVRCSLHLLRSTDTEVHGRVWVSFRGIFTRQLGNTLTASPLQGTRGTSWWDSADVLSGVFSDSVRIGCLSPAGLGRP